MKRSVIAAFVGLSLASTAFAQTPAADPKAGETAKPAAEAKPAAKPAAPSVLQIKLADDTSIKFGIMAQARAEWQENAANTGYQQDLYLRRIRLLFGGQIGKQLFFFAQTENSSLGKYTGTTKTISTGLQMLDAVVEWRVHKAFNLWGGLIYVPTSREALKSSSSEFMLDVGTYAYTASTALASTGGRDTGFQARGYFANDRLEYRVGVFQGLRETGGRNAFRSVSRLQYNFFDTEVYNLPAYASSFLGNKKILALGVACDFQRDYKGYTGDIQLDFPVSFGSVQSYLGYQNLDGGKTLATLPAQDILQAEIGAYFKKAKIGVWGRYEQRTFDDSRKDETRFQTGLNYYIRGNNLNLKAMYQRFDIDTETATVKGTNQFVLQLQAAYF
ncbi:MAG: hypothetical protein IT186_16220 [Acidobacteria bacterium]|nr:hypothetical protein [Acidobacteriota bacterium]MCK6684385.1 OprO/OprP family phosphate-selective porin [Thermoanaerobaculia bacterium]